MPHHAWLWDMWKSKVDHPDSDHLHTTSKHVVADTVRQIVCGAAIIEAGQRSSGQPGAVMPDGLIIWPGHYVALTAMG